MPTNPFYYIKKMSPRELDFCSKVISSDAFSAIICNHLLGNFGVSVVRMADGEKAVIDVSNGLPKTGFLKDEKWLKKYGLFGANLVDIGKSLLWAGQHATFFGPSLSGLYSLKYDVQQFFQERKQYIDIFYHRYWYARKYWEVILQYTQIAVVHHDSRNIGRLMQKRYNLTKTVQCFDIKSWEDHPKIEKYIGNTPAKLILVSAGPSGKAMIVRMAQTRPDQVVLDIGGTMELLVT